MSRCHARTLPRPRATSARRPASFALRLLTRVTRPVTLLQQPRRLPPCAAARNALGGQWRRGAASVWARPPTRGHLQRTHVGPRQRWKSSANALPKRWPELACPRSLHCRQRPCHHVARSAIPHRKQRTWLTLLPAQRAATSRLWQNAATVLWHPHCPMPEHRTRRQAPPCPCNLCPRRRAPGGNGGLRLRGRCRPPTLGSTCPSSCMGLGSCAQRPQLVGVTVRLMRCPGAHWSPP